MTSLQRTALAAGAMFAFGCDGDRLPADPTLEAARRPVVEVFPINDEFDLACDGFTAHLSYTGSGRVTTYFDGAGSASRLRIQTSVKGSAVNTSTSRLLRDDEISVISVDLTTSEVTVNGAPAHVTAPGEGIIIHDTGRIVFDGEGNVTFEAGPHDQAEVGALQAYCSALS